MDIPADVIEAAVRTTLFPCYDENMARMAYWILAQAPDPRIEAINALNFPMGKHVIKQILAALDAMEKP